MRSLYLFSVLLLIGYQLKATTFTVTNLNDSGSGSLRQVILDLNIDNNTPHIVNFAVSGQIDLLTFLPGIQRASTFNGPAVTCPFAKTNLIINRAVEDKFTLIYTWGTASPITFNNLTFQNGDGTASPVAAGAIHNASDMLTLNNCVFLNNKSVYGGAISNSSYVYPLRSMRINGCYFAYNTANWAGAINNYVMNTEITNSTFYRNNYQVTYSNKVGAVFNSQSPMKITNCTFFENGSDVSEVGAIFQETNDATTLIENCTIIANEGFLTGGFYPYGGVATVNNTIMAGNWIHDEYYARLEHNMHTYYAPVSSTAGHNLFGNVDDVRLTGNTTGNQVNIVASTIIKGELASNDGCIPTLALKAGSPAIDAGTGTGSDQRGVAVFGTAKDMGSYEFNSPCNVPPLIAVPSAGITAGQSATLTATGCIGDVVWNTGLTGNQLVVAPSTTTSYTAVCTTTAGCSSSAVGSVTVSVANLPPVAATVSPLSVTIGIGASLILPSFTDPESQSLTHSLNGLPTGLNFTASSRLINGTAATGTAGTYRLTYSASDGTLVTSATLSLTVVAPPVVTGNFEGYLSSVNCQEMRGWVWNRDKPNAPVWVEFFVDGVSIGSLEARNFRQDLKNAGKGNGEHGYVFPTPEPAKQGRTTAITAKVLGSTYVLKDSPKSLNCPGSFTVVNLPPVAPAVFPLSLTIGIGASVTLASFTDAENQAVAHSLSGLPSGLAFTASNRLITGTAATGTAGTYVLTYSASDGTHVTSINVALTVVAGQTVPPPAVVTGNFEGYLSSVNCQEMRGWVWNRDKPNAPVLVEFFADGVSIGSLEARNFRQDLKTAGKGNGEHGYVFSTPSELKDNVNHQISAKVQNSVYVLKGSPIALKCAPSGRLASAVESPLDVSVRGNPVLGNEIVIEIRGIERASVQLQLMDTNGRPVNFYQAKQEEQAGGLIRTLRLTDQPSGILFLQVMGGSHLITKKISKP